MGGGSGGPVYQNLKYPLNVATTKGSWGTFESGAAAASGLRVQAARLRAAAEGGAHAAQQGPRVRGGALWLRMTQWQAQRDAGTQPRSGVIAMMLMSEDAGWSLRDRKLRRKGAGCTARAGMTMQCVESVLWACV